MEEQGNTYKIYGNDNGGEVFISNDVIAVIAAMASMEVDGVEAMAGNITSDIIAKLGMKKLSRGVRVTVDEGSVMVDLSIVLRMNQNVIKISKKVQDKVKTAIENMTGMTVENVNVNISSVLAK